MNNQFYLDNEEQTNMFFNSTFIYVNLFYITGFSIYKLYSEYTIRKLQKKNKSLKTEQFNLVTSHKIKLNKMQKQLDSLSEEKSYLISLLEDSDMIIRTRKHLSETLKKYGDLKFKYNKLKEKHKIVENLYDTTAVDYNKLADKQEDLENKYNNLKEKHQVVEKLYDTSADDYNKLVDEQEDMEDKSKDLLDKNNKLNKYNHNLKNENSELKINIVDLEADVFEKNNTIEKLENLVDILEKETNERKIEIIKLRKKK